MSKMKRAERALGPVALRWRMLGHVTKLALTDIGKDNLSIVSAGVAFYIFLALFPAIAAFISIYGMVANPDDVARLISGMQGVLPPQVIQIVTHQMMKIAASPPSALRIGVVVSLLFALWSAMNGTMALMQALTIAYEEQERRGFLRFSAEALLLTLGTMLAFVIAIIFVIGIPALLHFLRAPGLVLIAIAWLRWPVLAFGMVVGLAILYRFGPSRASPRWHWMSFGAITATVLWLIGSALFSWYVSHSGSYNATYGSLAAIVILLMWAYISALVVLFGAELNSEIEQEAEKRTAGSD